MLAVMPIKKCTIMIATINETSRLVITNRFRSCFKCRLDHISPKCLQFLIEDL